MRIGKRINTILSFVISTAVGLIMTWFSVAGMNEYILPAVAGALLLVVCFVNFKAALLILITSMLLSPEIIVGSTEKRAITVRFDDIMLMIITTGWIFRMAIVKDIGFSRKNLLNKPIVIFCALVVLSTSLGVLRGNVKLLSGAFFVLKLIEYFFLFQMVVNYVENEKDIYLFMRMMLFVCGIICIYAFFQAITGGDVAAPFEGSRGERNTLGGYLVLIGSVVGGMLFYRDKGNDFIYLILLLFGIITTLLFSLSRSGWAGFMVSFVALFIIAKKLKILLLIMLISVPLLPFVIPEKSKKRFEYTFNESYAAHRRQIEIFGVRLDGSSSARLRSYGLVLKEAPKHLLLGYGVTGFAFVDGQFFRLLSETGVAGLGVFIWLLVSVYILILKAKSLQVPDSIRGMTVGFQAGFWGVITHAFTANTFIIIRIAEPFWFFTGLITVVTIIYDKQKNIMSVNNISLKSLKETPLLDIPTTVPKY